MSMVQILPQRTRRDTRTIESKTPFHIKKLCRLRRRQQHHQQTTLGRLFAFTGSILILCFLLYTNESFGCEGYIINTTTNEERQPAEEGKYTAGIISFLSNYTDAQQQNILICKVSMVDEASDDDFQRNSSRSLNVFIRTTKSNSRKQNISTSRGNNDTIIDSKYVCQPRINNMSYSEALYEIDLSRFNVSSTILLQGNRKVQLTGARLDNSTATVVNANKYNNYTMELLPMDHEEGSIGRNNNFNSSIVLKISSRGSNTTLTTQYNLNGTSLSSERKGKTGKRKYISEGNDDEPLFGAMSSNETNTTIASSSSISSHYRRETMGIMRVLVVRIIGKDSEPTVSVSDLRQYTFLESVSLKNQMYKCSAGQLILVPALIGNDTSGVLNLQLDNTTMTGLHRSVVVNQAMDEIYRLYGFGSNYNNDTFDNETSSSSSSSLSSSSTTTTTTTTTTATIERRKLPTNDIADFFMLIVPPGTIPKSWAAYGVVDGRLTVYNDRWGAYVSTTMHEVGHNLGLYHSRQNGGSDVYDGQTGYMGAAMKRYNYPQKCYNSQNHWHLGWFQDKALDIDASQLLTGPMLVYVASFVDYDKLQFGSISSTGNLYYVVVRVNTNFYMQYNRAKGYNIGTTESANQLVIVEHNSSFGITDEIAGLDLENKIFVKNIIGGNGTEKQRNLVIEVCSIVDGNIASNGTAYQPDYMVVSIGYDESRCTTWNESDQGSPAPTPTQMPNRTKGNTPSLPPSRSPSIKPSKQPSMGQQQQPTSVPTVAVADNNSVLPSADNATTSENEGSVETEYRFSRGKVLAFFLVSQFIFLAALFGIYILFHRDHKRQKAFRRLEEEIEIDKRLIAMMSAGYQDGLSLQNEPGDGISSTGSWSSESFSIRRQTQQLLSVETNIQ